MLIVQKFAYELISLSLMGLICLGFMWPEESKNLNSNEPGFAVLELFTSQGCSSCPPADRLLNQILDQAEAEKSPVYGLSFHVDYWNYIGWEDPYSSKEWSKRQRNYAQVTGDRRVYTPQLMVNGKDGLVGSDKENAYRAIEKALNTPAEVQLDIQVEAQKEQHQLIVNYLVEGDWKDRLLNLAIVQEEAENYVKRGENATKTLYHMNVVRAMTTTSIVEANGSIEITIPEELSWEQVKLISYVQHPQTYHITGVARVSLESL